MNIERQDFIQKLADQGVSADRGELSVRGFFEEHKDFFATYAGDSSIRVEKSPESLNTFAIDLEKGVLYGDPKYFTKKGYSESKAFFAFLHEFEHFRELRELMGEPGGDKIWKRRADRLKRNQRSKLFDNIWDDVRMNRSVISRAPSQNTVKSELYRENLFQDSNFLNLPKHLQFAYALLREAMLPEEKCQIAPEVRSAIDRLRSIKSKSGLSLLDYASRPDIPPSLRIKLQENFLEPAYESFFEEDAEQKKNEQKSKERGQGDEDKEEDKGTAGEMPQNPEDFFKDEYKEYFDKNPDNALPGEIIENAVKDYIARKKENKKSEEQMIEEAYALEQGVKPEDLKSYQKFWEEIEGLKNPETNEAVVEELRELFRKIIAERTRPRQKPKLPVSEGEILARPAEAVAAVKAGGEEPEVWETIQEKSRPKELFGDFDITIITDRSGSMEECDESGNIKKYEQKKAVILLLEALKEFSDDLEEARADLQYDLNVRMEARSFGSENENEILKPLSEELTEKQRVAVYKKLDSAPGSSTKDFLALESVLSSIADEDIEKIEAKRLKKIILVLSDGASDNPERVQKSLHQLRDKGVIVRGIGITNAASSIKQTYKPHALICKQADQLGVILAELLKEHLTKNE